MYGEDEGKVIASVKCPNCGSLEAKLRAKKKEASKRLVSHVTCHKCRRTFFAGFTRVETLAMARLRTRLEKKRDNAKTESERERIDQKIAELEEKGKFNDLY
jgi:ssDNA-binding Zn-finger/Zn-ribbon topoisomerase 1